MPYALLTAKAVLVLGLLFAGIWLLLAGAHIAPIPWISYTGFAAYNVPIGIVVIASGIALAKLWKIEVHHTVTEIREDNGTKWTRTENTSTKYLIGPKGPKP